MTATTSWPSDTASVSACSVRREMRFTGTMTMVRFAASGFGGISSMPSSRPART